MSSHLIGWCLSDILFIKLTNSVEIVWSAAGCGGRGSARSTPGGKKPRRRVASVAQRRAANIRERRRMFNLNEAFDKLRRKVGHHNLKKYYLIYFVFIKPTSEAIGKRGLCKHDTSYAPANDGQYQWRLF